MDKIEHLGIAVRDIVKSNQLFSALLNTEPYKQEEVKSENVLTSFFRIGDSKVELLQATSPESAIAKFIEKRGEGLHHVAFAVTDIHAEMKRLREAGFEFINNEPKQGADNKIIAFIHPKFTNGLLVELCMESIFR